MVSHVPEATAMLYWQQMSHIWRKELCKHTKKTLDCEDFILFRYVYKDEAAGNISILFLTCSHKQAAHKEGLITFMQREQCIARDRAKKS